MIMSDLIDSGVDWIGEIPQGWEIKTLKRTAFIHGRIGWQGLTSEEYLDEGDFYLVTGTEFYNGVIKWEDCHFVESDRFQQDKKIQLQIDDVLITKDGTIGKIALIDYLPKPATLNSGVFIARAKNNAFISRFLFWILVSDLFPQFIEYSKVGTTINHLYQKTFEQLIYPLPPLPEQKLISAYLDKTTATIENAVSVKKKQLEKLEEFKKSIIYKAVTKGLDDSVEMKDSGIEWIGGIPKGWKIKKLKQLTKKINSGVTPKGGAETYLSEGIPLIRSQNVHFKELVFYDMAYINEETHLNMSNSHVRKGDVLLNITGASIGRCYYYSSENEANVNQHVCIIRPINKNITKLLYQIMASEVGQSQIFSGFRGASREGLNFKDLKNFFIPLPNYNEQQVIINYLDHKTSEIDTVSEKITLQIEKLEEYKKSLIHECVTGKRRITEADVQEAVYA